MDKQFKGKPLFLRPW